VFRRGKLIIIGSEASRPVASLGTRTNLVTCVTSLVTSLQLALVRASKNQWANNKASNTCY